MHESHLNKLVPIQTIRNTSPHRACTYIQPLYTTNFLSSFKKRIPRAMVYDNINCTDLLCESMQHTDRFQSQRLKPCPRHYLKQSHEISKPQTGMFHQKGDDLNPLNFTQSKWTAETWSLTNAWSRHQIAGSEMRKVHPEDTATGLSPNRYKQPKWAVQLLHYYTQMARNIFYVLMMLCTRGGKTSSLLLCGDFKEEHILKSWKEKKRKKNQIKILLMVSLC